MKISIVIIRSGYNEGPKGYSSRAEWSQMENMMNELTIPGLYYIGRNAIPNW